jgi:Spy/CpxP family protein refolding chaperone
MAHLHSLLRQLFLLVVLVIVPLCESHGQEPVPEKGQQQPGERDAVVILRYVPSATNRRGPDSSLLSLPNVVNELKLTDAQKKSIGELAKQITKESAPRAQAAREQLVAIRGNPELTDEQRAVLLREAYLAQVGGVDAFYAQQDAAYRKILTPAQWKRLQEIRIQRDGPFAFTRDDMISQLNIDDVQIELIREIVEGSRKQYTEAGRIVTPVPEEGFQESKTYQDRLAQAIKSSDRLHDSIMDQVKRTLRKKQWETYLRLRGEPFEMNRLMPQGTAPRPKKEAAKAAETSKVDATSGKSDAEEKAGGSPAGDRKTLKEKRGGPAGP